MTAPGRRLALCAQTNKVLTGIDFVQVVDPADQTVLRVFFIIDPTATNPAIVTTVPAIPSGQDEGPPVAVDASITARLATEAEDILLPIVDLRWRRVRTFGAMRVVLEIVVAEPGGFEPYRLTVGHLQMDVLGGTILVDFKQACPTAFDCEADPDCPGDPLEDVPIDYLARDFYSIRTALLDFAAARYPDWREPLEADTGVMLMEVMAALGDEFAYQQDRIDAETRFATATQRRSLAALARLVDYRIGRGVSASGDLAVTALANGNLPLDSIFWARPDAFSAIPYSTTAACWIHPFWNARPAHNPDPEQDCLGHGITSLMLKSALAAPGETPLGVTRKKFLIGKRVMILSDPADPALPRRAIPVTITAIDEFTDALILTNGNPTFVTRIFWDDSEATAFELPFDGLSVAMNIIPVAAGEAVAEYFRIGTEDDVTARFSLADPLLLARMRALMPAVEREGSIDHDSGGRDVIFRYGLRATEHQSLRHGDDGLPVIHVDEVIPPLAPPNPLPVDDGDLFALFTPDTQADDWQYLDDLLAADLDTPAFTVEPGMWRTVKRHQLPFGEFAFQDYAANSGWTLRFGSGDFGRAPSDGALLRVTFHTDPGVVANVASESLSLDPPEGIAVQPAVAALVASATNPLPFNNARAEESTETMRLLAPEAYRAEPRRAVRPEDYSSIIERKAFVQRANSTTHWTGSWSTDFVAVDPRHSVALADPERIEVEGEIECVRLAGRDARRADPDYVDVDIEILICVTADAYPGEVLEALYTTLSPPGFFSPDNFTFGTPLVRSSLEAAVQAVPGVKFVDSISIRVQGMGDWRPFTEFELVAGPSQIIRLQNDPDRAALGLLRIKSHGGR